MITKYNYEKDIVAFIQSHYAKGAAPRGLLSKSVELYDQYHDVAMERSVPTMKRPAVAAACVYVAAGLLNKHIRQSDLAAKFGVSEPTLRKAAGWIWMEFVDEKRGCGGVALWTSRRARI